MANGIPPREKACNLYVIPLGLEPKTHSLEGCCSIQLSYGTIPAKGIAKLVIFRRNASFARGSPVKLSGWTSTRCGRLPG